MICSEGVQSDATGSLVIKPCTRAEVAFYESVRDHPALQAHMPTFMGTLCLHKDQLQTSLPNPAQTWHPSGGKKLDTGLAIVLENVTAGFERPNVLDLKLGARLWADEAPPAKRQRLDAVSAESTSSSLGFRIAGMKVWKGRETVAGDDVSSDDSTRIMDGYKCFNKKYGCSFKNHDVKRGFLEFLNGPSTSDIGERTETVKTGSAKLMAKRLAREVENIKDVIEHEESRMYSASLLMVYEGNPEALNTAIQEKGKRDRAATESDLTERGIEDEGECSDEGGEEELPKVYDVRLIDFAHAEFSPGQGPDENILRGIRNLLRILDELSEEGPS